MSKPVYLGKIRFRWCNNCNVPVLGDTCGRCGSTTINVNITPPGEFRLPLKNDWKFLDLAFSDILEKKFSDLFSRYAIVLNRIPGEDRTEEIILGGRVVATVLHEDLEIRVSLRPHFYYVAKDYLKDIFVTTDLVAAESIKSGNNLMVPGVIYVGKDVKPGRDVFIKTEEGDVIALGISRIDKNKKMERGMAVKVKYIMEENEKIFLKESGLEEIIEANREFMEKEEKKAIDFLKNFREKNLLVSFSGGKDSLVALHLTLRAGIKPKVVFLNTGLEFPETIEYVKKMAREFSLHLDIIDAGDAFYRNLEHFGPPGRDYRWCCKVCKLGPTTRYIKSLGEGKIYMVIGQRAYESPSRASSGNIWENEWVPNQIGISPIQKWNSFMVWLYIFMHGLNYNPWYDRGLWRIGCFMCPSQDLGDLNIVSSYGIYEKWESYLVDYATRNNLKEEWIKYALWRWNKIPDHLKKKYSIEDHKREALKLEIKENEGKLKLIPNKEIDMKRLMNLKNILPESAMDETLNIKENFVEKAIQVIYQSEECVGCGICTGRCDRNALYLSEGRVWVDEEKCIRCTKCLGPCPAYVFR